ncbi:MAG: glutathione peroxidase [Acidimicrobiales bacterium]
MSVYDHEIASLDGEPLDLHRFSDRTLLVVNVASLCGLTPQYSSLQQLQERYGPERFSVLGVPCNQFGEQEPGSPEDIREFCSTSYGVSFPMTEKVDVNGPGRHPLYGELTAIEDGEGQAGDIAWNFEKFLIAAGGATVRRFRPQVEPDSDLLVGAIEASLAG